MAAKLTLDRQQILAHRRRAGELDERQAWSPDALRRAAWVGLQDSMPRAALLSIHARVSDTGPAAWEDPALVQVWGPRSSAYVVAAEDLAVFTLGRLPPDGAARHRAVDTADRLDEFLAGRRMRFGEAGHGMGVAPNSLRYAAPTGRVLLRWDGARQPTVWIVPQPEVDPREAHLELARRYLQVFGPSTEGAFLAWAGIRASRGQAASETLRTELVPVRTPVGDGWILATDEAAFRAPSAPRHGVRLLPSGDAYFLLQGSDRALLVPQPDQQRELWTPRVWPGALLVDGEIAGVWRRDDAELAIHPWRRLSPDERAAVEAEAASLPLPGVMGRLRTSWT